MHTICITPIQDATLPMPFPFGQTEEERLRSLGKGQAASLAGYAALNRLCRELDGDLTVHRDAHGRPFFANAASYDYNVSHSHALAVAILSNGRVGIDIERIDPLRRMGDIAKRYFGDEAKACQTEAELFLLWTKKEALAKYDGRGLSLLLSLGLPDTALAVPHTRSYLLTHGHDTYACSVCTEHAAAPSWLVPDGVTVTPLT